MTGEPSASRGAIWPALLSAVAIGFCPAVSSADGLRDGLFKKPSGVGRTQAPPPVARYISEDGHVFILDRTQARPLLKFDDSPEVWALSPQPAPRGDIIYKNDLGESVLRATRVGGITLFTDHRPGGEAVSLTGPGAPLRPQLLSAASLLDRLGQASFRSARAAGHGVPYFADSVRPESAALTGDAAMLASLAILRLASRRDGASILSAVRRVRIAEGKTSAAVLEAGTLTITIAPALGLAGRPSSERIEKVLTQGR